MRPKRNETAKQAVERWADELLASQNGDMYYALLFAEWLKVRLETMQQERTEQ